MADLVIPCIIASPSTRNWELGYAIAPGGSFQEVRNAATGGEGTGHGTTRVTKGPHSDWPYYYWTLNRCILWFDLSAYTPAYSETIKIRFKKPYISSYHSSDWANDSFLALDDEGKVPTQADLTGDDYGSWKSNSTILGSMPGTEYGSLPLYQYYYIVLNAAGREHLNWSGLTAFVLRTNKDVNNVTTPLEATGETEYHYYGPGNAETDRPALILENAAGLPTVTTDPATSVLEAIATLNGTLEDDGGQACDCGFEWGETEAYGNTTPTQSRTTGQTFSQVITGLDPNKTYHFRAFATNAAPTSYGADRTFTTPVATPTVTTDAATGLGMILATLNGALDADGGEPCACGFEHGLDITYGMTTPVQSKTTGQTFSQVIRGLFPGTTYHFRALATNSFGTSYGADRTLNTSPIISRAYALAREEL